MQDGTPIIVKKVKKHGHAHHGGAWKVAYADFVTAMMAFFMVLWILGMDQEQREAVSQYFKNPYPWPESTQKLRPNILPPNSSRPQASGKSSATAPSKNVAEVVDRARLNAIKKEVESKIASDPVLKQMAAAGDVNIRMTGEGLKIELIENEANGEVFFQIGSAIIRPNAKGIFARIAPVLAESKRYMYIDGHTDSRPMTGAFDNFDLSAGRANAVRKLLTANGLDPKQVVQVRGKADTEPRMPEDPMHFSNRRVTVLLPFNYVKEPTMEVPADPRDEDSSALFNEAGDKPRLPDLRNQVTPK